MMSRSGRHAHRNMVPATCRSDDDPDCRRRAVYIAEWVWPGHPPFRLPVCKRHARQKRRNGWGVVRAYQHELSALAAAIDAGGRWDPER